MKTIETLQKFEQIKLLADERRMAILRLLMAEPATLTLLGEALGQSPAWVRHHIQKLEAAGLVELGEVRTTGKVREKFYRAKAGAYLLQELVYPQSDKPVLVFAGSHDLAIELIAGDLAAHLDVLILPVGSLDGLVNLRQGISQMSGAHLLDENGEYNRPYVCRFFPDRAMQMVTLANRTQGLMVAPDNPLGLYTPVDLLRAGIRFINRNAGSGTRLWMDAELKRLGMAGDQINGYQQQASTHNQTAQAVAAGQADAALGLQAAAEKHGLDFIPLFEERYDLVFPAALTRQLEIFLNYVQSAVFRRQLTGLGGYQSSGTGTQVALV